MSAGPVDGFDAAFVLGAMVRPDGSPSPAMARRVAHGVRLAAEGRVEHLVMSGAAVGYPVPEARIMADLAMAAGLGPERVILEEQAPNTIGNARYCKALAEQRGWRRMLLVTDAFHMPRALYAFRRLGLRVRPAPAWPRSRPSWAWCMAWLRELVALPWTVIRVERRLWAEGRKRG